MKSYLPELSNRSLTPLSSNGKGSSFRIKPKISFMKSVRNISLSPIHSSASRKDSNDTIPNSRAVSDEVHSTFIDSDSNILKLTSMFSRSNPKVKRPYQKIVLEKITNYSEIIDALFSMYDCERGRIPAYQLVQLFIGLGYIEDCEVLIGIFKNICEGQTFNLISFSKNELLRLCEDQRAENILKVLIKDARVRSNEVPLASLIAVIKRWWAHLDKSQNGFVSFEEICKFYMEVGVIENSSDSKRIFLKIGQFGNYRQFTSVFAKSLFKFLLRRLGELVKQKSKDCLSAEVAISSQRRKVILQSLQGENKVIDSIIECSIYNN